MTVTHRDVLARLDGRPMSSYPDAVAELHGRSVPVTPEPTEAERKRWRDHVWFVDCIDQDAAKPR